MAVHPRGWETGWRLAQGETRLRCLGEHFPARWMSWDWSTWIRGGKGQTILTLMILSREWEEKVATWLPLLPAQWSSFPQMSSTDFHLRLYQHVSKVKAEFLLPLSPLLLRCLLTYNLGQQWCSAAARAAREEAQAPWGDTCCKGDCLQRHHFHQFTVMQGKPVKCVIFLSMEQQMEHIINTVRL